MDTMLRILYLNQKDVYALGGDDMGLAVKDIERVFELFEAGDVLTPDKVSMNFGKTIAEEKTKGRINAMPGYLGGEYNMAGMKWIGSNPSNLQKGLPRASAITILNDPLTKFPVCIMDGSLISAMRTGAVGGVAAKYLAKENSKSVLMIGAGFQSRTQLEAILVGQPNLENIFVTDLNFELAELYAVEMSKKLARTVQAINQPKQYAQLCDIVVTVTGASSPVLDADWLSSGCLYINIGGFECSYATVEKANRRFVDNWIAVKHRNTSAIAKMANEGLLEDKDVDANIGEVINKTKLGRRSNEEIIYFNSVGMGIADIAVATRLYNKAITEKIGQSLSYWD